ncbi:Hypothetical predicted protein [Podarcis lilfordi]|uniref:Uncharacterized protein n=1 Tax=Podarcis lilfordi TaxID=74358 RepID=A0AA35VYL3_9SAUR|nr:Hypothetical predicted protein [Podarcis lilfordi]
MKKVEKRLFHDNNKLSKQKEASRWRSGRLQTGRQSFSSHSGMEHRIMYQDLTVSFSCWPLYSPTDGLQSLARLNWSYMHPTEMGSSTPSFLMIRRHI